MELLVVALLPNILFHMSRARLRETKNILKKMWLSRVMNLIYHLVSIDPSCAKLNNLIFHSLEFASRYRDPQIQVSEKYPYLFILGQNI